MMTNNPVSLSISNGIASICLNRPDRLNAINEPLMLELLTTLQMAANDESVKVITITGAGRAFSAGQDLADRDPRKLDGPLDIEGIQRRLFHPVIRAIREARKPVVARVNGLAAGAGAAIALACDIVIAADTAKFIFSFSKVGLSVDAGGGYALVKAIGPARARAALMLGEAIAADEAEKMGLIWKCVPLAEFGDKSNSLVEQLVKAPSQSMASIKQAVQSAEDAVFEDYLQKEAHLQGLAGRHPDYAEGVLAFLEKRKPDFGKA